MEKVPVDRRRCESTFSFPLTSKANARANVLLFLDISAAHSARLLLQLLLWQQKTLSAAICYRRCQLCFSLKKCSCQLFIVKKDAKCEHSLMQSLDFQMNTQTSDNRPSWLDHCSERKIYSWTPRVPSLISASHRPDLRDSTLGSSLGERQWTCCEQC